MKCNKPWAYPYATKGCPRPNISMLSNAAFGGRQGNSL